MIPEATIRSVQEDLERAGWEAEMIVVGPLGAGPSPSGWVHVEVERGEAFAAAASRGISRSSGDMLLILDALALPADLAPLIEPVRSGQADLVVGRDGASQQGLWRLASLLSKPLASMALPVSPYLCFAKTAINGQPLNPGGGGLSLEIAAQGGRALAVPLEVAPSPWRMKSPFRAFLAYLLQIHRLMALRSPQLVEFFRFALVGASGVVVDLSVTASLVEILAQDPRIAAFFAFWVAVTTNYILNSLWTFKGTRRKSHLSSYLLFILVCIGGVGIKISVMHLLMVYAGMNKGHWYLVASFIGIVVATAGNFLGSKFLAFRGPRT